MKINWYDEVYGSGEPNNGYRIITDDLRQDITFEHMTEVITWIIQNPDKSFAVWHNDIKPELILSVTQ